MNEIVNISISSQLCYVIMETIWKNTGGFVDGRIILNLKEIGVDMMSYIRIKITGEPLLTWY